MVQEAVQPIGGPLFPFKLQGSLETDPDKKFEVMSKTGDQR